MSLSTGKRIAVVLGSMAVGMSWRPLISCLVAAKLRRNAADMNRGDLSTMLASYTADASLMFNDGPHRFAGPDRGVFRGSVEIKSFLQEFITAGVHGKVRDVWTAGPPWAMTVIVRFDDSVDAPDGTPLYANNTVIVLKMRGMKVCSEEIFFLDTQRIADLEQELRRRGNEPAGADSVTDRRGDAPPWHDR